MRRAFSDTLTEVASENDKFIFLTGDLGFQVFSELEEKFPEKYINTGIAEAHLVNCAAGLALNGYYPVVYSIASFMTGRAYEPIRVSINYHKLPVLIVGAGGGYIYSNSGVTHHAAEDMALMQTLPGMSVLNPGSPTEVKELVKQHFSMDSPSYMRVGRFGEPEYEALDEVVFGKARNVSKGKDILLVSTGDSVIACSRAIDELKEKYQLNFSHIQYHTLAPFDRNSLIEAMKQHSHVVVVEEHFPVGGLYSIVCQLIAANHVDINLHRLGPKHELVLGSPPLDSLRADYGYDKQGIIDLCLKVVSN